MSDLIARMSPSGSPRQITLPNVVLVPNFWDQRDAERLDLGVEKRRHGICFVELEDGIHGTEEKTSQKR